jgi:hypothetical protein
MPRFTFTGEQTTEIAQQELLQNTRSVATSILQLIPRVTVFLFKRNSVNHASPYSSSDWFNPVIACLDTRSHWLKRCHVSHRNSSVGQL